MPPRGLVTGSLNAVEFEAKFVTDEMRTVAGVEEVAGHLPSAI
jgi:hypothetical protein